MTLDEVCENARQLSTEHGWDQVDPMSRMLQVTAEVGEVADALISLQATADDHARPAARHELGCEIFDAIWNLCALANATGVDIEKAAARDKIATNGQRVWPSDSTT